jgi:DNA invertase Pin-like site-specific DNA recombinase
MAGVEADAFRLVERHDCPMSTCQAPAGSPCRTGRGKVAAQYHTARFRLVPQLAKELTVSTPALRHPGTAWSVLPPPAVSVAEQAGHVRIGYARASTRAQSLDSQLDALTEADVPRARIFAEKVSTRVRQRPELKRAIDLACELRAAGVAVTFVVPEHKRLGRGADLVTLAEHLRACDVQLEFLTGELRGTHDPGGLLFAILAAMSGMEREYIREQTLNGQEAARRRGKAIGGATVVNDAMTTQAVVLRHQGLSLREIASKLVITSGKNRGKSPSPATVMRLLRDYDDAQDRAVQGDVSEEVSA